MFKQGKIGRPKGESSRRHPSFTLLQMQRHDRGDGQVRNDLRDEPSREHGVQTPFTYVNLGTEEPTNTQLSK